MIKAEDLRRGNAVNSKTHNLSFAIVEGVTPSGIVMLKGITTYDMLSKLEPIQVTAEILNLFGFSREEYSRTCSIQIGNTLYLEIDVDDFETSIVPETWRGNTCSTWKRLQYVHDVQNAYYDLTGEHLKLKQ